MDKTIMTIAAVAAMAITGCKPLPTTDNMSDLGFATGCTAAYVLNNQVKVDDATRNAIIDIMIAVEQYIPGANETFEATWPPIAMKHVEGLVKDGKITHTVAGRVMKDFGYLTNLLDQYIEKKGVRQYQDLVDAFIRSFCRSFLTNFKPANVGLFSTCSFVYDKDAEEILMKAIEGTK